jgi:hypothetical protein
VTTRSELRRAWMGPRNCERGRRGVSMAPSIAATIGDSYEKSDKEFEMRELLYGSFDDTSVGTNAILTYDQMIGMYKLHSDDKRSRNVYLYIALYRSF